MLTAVGVSSLTGVTALAVHIRLDGATVSGLHILNLWSDLDDLDSQLVTGDPGVAEERHLAQVAADVGAAGRSNTNSFRMATAESDKILLASAVSILIRVARP